MKLRKGRPSVLNDDRFDQHVSFSVTHLFVLWWLPDQGEVDIRMVRLQLLRYTRFQRYDENHKILGSTCKNHLRIVEFILG